MGLEKQKVTGSVRLLDGTRINLKEVAELVPSHVFMSRLHVRICETAAKVKCSDNTLFPVLVNFYFTRSRVLRILTALYFLIEKGKVAEIEGGAIFGVDLALGDYTSLRVVETIALQGENFLPYSYIYFRQIPRMVLHKVFRLFAKTNVNTRVVRSWIDITDKIYEVQGASTTYLVYPFAANFRRQRKFFLALKGRGSSYSLMGAGYRFIDFVKLVVMPSQLDMCVAKVEADAFDRHAIELAKLGVTHLLTSDEFEPASIVFHRRLRHFGIHSSNRCHGIAVYGPYISATEMLFCNKKQSTFYALGGEFDHTSVIPFKSSNYSKALVSEGAPVYVYMHGNWIDKPYESKFAEKVMAKLQGVCAKNWKVKVHPDTSEAEIEQISTRYGVEVISGSLPMYECPVVFINFLSSAFYDFRHIGPTVFLKDDLLNPAELFGEGVDSYILDELPAVLDKMKILEVRQAVFNQQLEFVDGLALNPKVG